MRRCKNWAHKIFSWKYLTIWRPVLPVFPRAQSASFLISTLNSFQGVLKVSGCSGYWPNPCIGRWQVSVFSWRYYVFNELSLGLLSAELCRHQAMRAPALSDTFTLAVPGRAAIWLRGWLQRSKLQSQPQPLSHITFLWLSFHVCKMVWYMFTS